ncbi:hypothetical protein KFL_002280200 [Klebsormidium nitens]|uniref:Uncharacterized protein n=1 Tax=Klebsormidium nitens TaxID=105231 RepID=A0A1Y1I2Z2_KLENI|nr:hypothetical protein KFL_002280200 [Klebsormidium nitens]|eukprot:GAQ85305.1 hypothetical protein KFL_002280200 [Klebsormidium nitens]
MAGLEALASTADAGLQKGFEDVLKSIMQAHLEGLQRPPTTSRRAHRASTNPAPTSPAATNQDLPRAGPKARERLTSFFVGDNVSHAAYCEECGAPATHGLRGSKEGGNLKYSCCVHRDFKRFFMLERTRAEWARSCEVYKVKAELARALDEESHQRGGNVWQQDGYWRDATPKSRHLIAKLLMMGGIESNPGPSSVGIRAEGECSLASGGDTLVLDGAAAHLSEAPPGEDPWAETDLLLHDVPPSGAAMESTAVPSAGEIGVMVQDQDGEATPSTPVAPRMAGRFRRSPAKG